MNALGFSGFIERSEMRDRTAYEDLRLPRSLASGSGRGNHIHAASGDLRLQRSFASGHGSEPTRPHTGENDVRGLYG